MTGGTVRDIRTGRAIGKTASLTATFLLHVQTLLETDEEFYLVYGRCRHSDVRCMIDELKEAIGESAPLICDARMPADTVWIFQGQPEELGFASGPLRSSTSDRGRSPEACTSVVPLSGATRSRSGAMERGRRSWLSTRRG